MFKFSHIERNSNLLPVQDLPVTQFVSILTLGTSDRCTDSSYRCLLKREYPLRNPKLYLWTPVGAGLVINNPEIVLPQSLSLPRLWGKKLLSLRFLSYKVDVIINSIMWLCELLTLLNEFSGLHCNFCVF
jgi:hypothetical protein